MIIDTRVVQKVSCFRRVVVRLVTRERYMRRRLAVVLLRSFRHSMRSRIVIKMASGPLQSVLSPTVKSVQLSYFFVQKIFNPRRFL